MVHPLQFVLFLLFSFCFSSVDVTKLKSFSSVIKGGLITGGDTQTIFEMSGQGAITFLQLTLGPDLPTTFTIYVDKELTPSIEFNLQFGALGIGGRDSTMFGLATGGKQAGSGGLYSSVQIPFSSHILIKMTLTANTTKLESFFTIIHGIEGPYPVTINGKFELPLNAKLKVYKTNQVLDLFKYGTIAKSTNSSGILYMISFEGSSNLFIFLEGCYRALVDSKDITFLSSGSEDFYISANYFDGGEFRNSYSGCTHKDEVKDISAYVSAYRYFHNDPVIWHNSFELILRNSEDLNCPFSWPPSKDLKYSEDLAHIRAMQSPQSQDSSKLFPFQLNFTTYVWTYEY